MFNDGLVNGSKHILLMFCWVITGSAACCRFRSVPVQVHQ